MSNFWYSPSKGEPLVVVLDVVGKSATPPRHGVDGGRRGWTPPRPRPAAAAEPIRGGVNPAAPILSRGRPRRGPSDVRPASRARGKSNFCWHRIFLLLHRTSGGCAQDPPRFHPAAMPHPLRGAGHPQRGTNHPAGGPAAEDSFECRKLPDPNVVRDHSRAHRSPTPQVDRRTTAQAP